MKVVAALLALVGSAIAFVPSANVKSSTARYALIDDLPGATLPFPKFDPFELSDLGSESTLRWFRAAELKHSRVAMLATTGYIVQASGIHFPGMLSNAEGVSFESLSAMKPLDAWAAVPEGGRNQILFTIFFAEMVGEISQEGGAHYTKGGDLPTIIFPPVDFSGVKPDNLFKKQNAELNNGRLAMIAIMSFCAAANIPGSVPLLAGSPMF